MFRTFVGVWAVAVATVVLITDKAATAQTSTISIINAVWGQGGLDVNKVAEVKALCGGQTSCTFRVDTPDLGPPPPQPVSHLLRLIYKCGAKTDYIEKKDYEVDPDFGTG